MRDDVCPECERVPPADNEVTIKADTLRKLAVLAGVHIYPVPEVGKYRDLPNEVVSEMSMQECRGRPTLLVDDWPQRNSKASPMHPDHVRETRRLEEATDDE